MMVRALHAAGIEVILDVVYNHTGEGNQLGPTLSMRGVDNASYYWLTPQDPRYHMDFSGCGNTLNMQHPRVLQLIMDSLRYWVTEMRVDGFRFDLASTLARELFAVNRLGTFFDIIHQDPVLSQVKLIAEPWDVGEGGYQVGNFPVLWTEWNGKYRDCVRRFWKGDGGTVSEFATRLAGSSDLYAWSGRLPHASINFITCHDGFTLQDLVSYDDKHNEANGDDNKDGANDNNSWNCGAEGPTDDPAIKALRTSQKRNLVASLLLSQGVPMIYGGDELSHSQGGNNNAYCQDSEMTWLNWELNEEQKGFLEFVRTVARIRAEQPVFHRRRFFLQRLHPRLRHQGHLLAQPRGRGDDGRGLEHRVRPLPGGAPGRRPDRRRERERRADRRRDAALAVQRPSRTDPVHAACDEGRAPMGTRVRHGRARRRGAAHGRGGALSAAGEVTGVSAHPDSGRNREGRLASAGGNPWQRESGDDSTRLTPLP